MNCHRNKLPEKTAQYILVVASLSTWARSRKNVPNSLSRCHTKRRIGARGHVMSHVMQKQI